MTPTDSPGVISRKLSLVMEQDPPLFPAHPAALPDSSAHLALGLEYRKKQGFPRSLGDAGVTRKQGQSFPQVPALAQDEPASALPAPGALGLCSCPHPTESQAMAFLPKYG